MALHTNAQHHNRDAADRHLLRRVAARDHQAFRELYIAYHRRLARFLMRVTREFGLVEEVINDTMLVVWNKADEFRGESRISTWIMAIAYRRALKTLRSSFAAPHAHDSLDDLQLEAPDELEASELGEWILSSLQQLPADQRLVVEFAYGHGHSCEEIAIIMDCPVNTVKTRLFHARKKLRVVMAGISGGLNNERG
jgi:RNA polymerase sigma-70 factor, ECF subfamily